jgi:polygalacturonase
LLRRGGACAGRAARNALNKAIDAAAAAGGGTVSFLAGTDLTGSVRLRSNVTLQLDHGAAIVASADFADDDPSLNRLIGRGSGRVIEKPIRAIGGGGWFDANSHSRDRGRTSKSRLS